MSEFLQSNGHPLVKSNTPLQVEVDVSMYLRCDLANYVPHFSPKKILPPLKHRPSYGLEREIKFLRAFSLGHREMTSLCFMTEKLYYICMNAIGQLPTDKIPLYNKC